MGVVVVAAAAVVVVVVVVVVVMMVSTIVDPPYLILYGSSQVDMWMALRKNAMMANGLVIRGMVGDEAIMPLELSLMVCLLLLLPQ